MSCKHSSSTVIDSRPHALGIRRRRKCDDCGHRWSTLECEIPERQPGPAVKMAGQCNQIVVEFFRLLGESGLSLSFVSLRSAVERRTMQQWRTKYGPKLENIEAALNVIGYELTIKKREEEQCIRAA